MSARRAAAVAAGIGVATLAAAGLSLGSTDAETKLVLDVRVEPATVVTDDRPPGGASPGDTSVCLRAA